MIVGNHFCANERGTSLTTPYTIFISFGCSPRLSLQLPWTGSILSRVGMSVVGFSGVKPACRSGKSGRQCSSGGIRPSPLRPSRSSGRGSTECYDESLAKSRGETCLPCARDRSVSGARGTDGASSRRAFRLSSPTAEILVAQLVLPPAGKTLFLFLSVASKTFFL
jgi:hypothetical protein